MLFGVTYRAAVIELHYIVAPLKGDIWTLYEISAKFESVKTLPITYKQLLLIRLQPAIKQNLANIDQLK